MSMKKTVSLLAISLFLVTGAVGAQDGNRLTGTKDDILSSVGIESTSVSIPKGILPGVFPGVGPVLGGQAGTGSTVSNSEKMESAEVIPSDEMKGSFFNGKNMPKTMGYRPFSNDNPSPGTYGGVLTVKGKSYTASALAAAAVFRGPKSDACF